MKKKNSIKFITFLLIVFISSIKIDVNAQEIYFTNQNNVNMTKYEYDKIASIFSEDYANIISQQEFNKYINSNIVDNNTLYLKTTYKNNVIVSQEEVSQSEYENSSESNSCSVSTRSSDNDYVETAYKKFTSTLSDFGNNDFTLTSIVTWKQVPACRSYDVFAFRLNHFSYIPNSVFGSQLYYVGSNYSQISYSSSSTGYKSLSNGAGFSMNLKDDSNITKFEMILTAELYINSYNYSEAHAYVSYQHAQSSLTQTQSKSYSLDVSGLGHVILFSSSSIESKYDDMPGNILISPIS